MTIQRLSSIEIAQVSGAAFNFGMNNGGPTGTGSMDTPMGTFSGNGFANPMDGGSRTVGYDGVFGQFGNTAGMSPTTGPSFSNIFAPAF